MRPVRIEELRESAVLLAAAPPRLARGTLIGFIGLVSALGVWSYLAWVPVTVRAEGRVQPAGRIWVVDAEVGGRVASVLVEEHQRIEKGGVLMKLDPTPLTLELKGIDRETEYLTPERDELGLMGQRLAKYERGKETSLQGLSRYRERFAAWLREFELAAVNVSRRQEESRRVEELGNVVSAAEKLAAKLGLAEAEATYSLALARHRGEVEKELEVARLRLQALEVLREQKRDQLARLEVRSPLSGRVTSLSVRQSGEVVRAGQQLFQIAPDEGFMAEVWVPAHEAGFVNAGMEGRVDFPTFPEASFGWLTGRVRLVSPDVASASGDPADGRGRNLYRVEIELKQDHLTDRDGRVGRLRLGLQARARLVVREERLLFLVAGLIREAFRGGI
jgi:multidrug resistance efflux pump